MFARQDRIDANQARISMRCSAKTARGVATSWAAPCQRVGGLG
jgi:hypothetical protein